MEKPMEKIANLYLIAQIKKSQEKKLYITDLVLEKLFQYARKWTEIIILENGYHHKIKIPLGSWEVHCYSSQ